METNKLFELKEEIEEAKTKHAKLEGSIETAFQSLKKNFSCSSLKQAEEKLKEIGDSIEKLKEELEAGMEDLEKKYGTV